MNQTEFFIDLILRIVQYDNKFRKKVVLMLFLISSDSSDIFHILRNFSILNSRKAFAHFTLFRQEHYLKMQTFYGSIGIDSTFLLS